MLIFVIILCMLSLTAGGYLVGGAVSVTAVAALAAVGLLLIILATRAMKGGSNTPTGFAAGMGAALVACVVGPLTVGLIIGAIVKHFVS